MVINGRYGLVLFLFALSVPQAAALSVIRQARILPLHGRPTGCAPTRVRCALSGPSDDASQTASRGGLRLLEWTPSQQLLVRTAKFVWQTLWHIMLSELAPQSADGAYLRPAPQAGALARADGSWPESLANDRPGRYLLYVGNACPWCHRALIAGSLRGLFADGAVTLVRLLDDPERASRGGWVFDARSAEEGESLREATAARRATDGAPPSIWDGALLHDPVFGAADLRGVYDALHDEASSDDARRGRYVGRVTAPLLIDASCRRLVSQESAEIVRLFGALDPPGRSRSAGETIDLYPPQLRAQIDATNGWVYETINDGVYRCGFASQQGAYLRAEAALHEGMARANEILSRSPFLTGEVLTEADVRLLPTAMRFDSVYAGLFRCGRRTVRADYPHIDRWMREVCAMKGEGALPLRATLDLPDAQSSYYTNLFVLNPSRIVPAALPDSELFGQPTERAEKARSGSDASCFARRTRQPTSSATGAALR